MPDHASIRQSLGRSEKPTVMIGTVRLARRVTLAFGGLGCTLAFVACGAQSSPIGSSSPHVLVVRSCSSSQTAAAGPLTEPEAERTAARQASTISGSPVTLVSVCVAKLRDALPGIGPGAGEPVSALVWNFRFRGEFGAGSCAGYEVASPPRTCPPAQPLLQVILDFRSGSFVEMGTPPG